MDIDNDGDFDIVASDFSGGRIMRHDNDGQGNFSAAIEIAEDVGVMRVSSQSLSFLTCRRWQPVPIPCTLCLPPTLMSARLQPTPSTGAEEVSVADPQLL